MQTAQLVMITARNEDAITTGEIWGKCLQVMCEKHALVKFVNKLLLISVPNMYQQH